MFRMPWFKGLLVSFPFDKWIKEHNGSSKIKDIYGNEYDIFEMISRLFSQKPI